MSRCGLYTLGDVVSLYCIDQGNDSRKGYENYLIHAKFVWNELLKRTLWAFQSTWVSTIKGNGPYPYVLLPQNMEYFMGIYQEDCGKLVPLFRSDVYSLVSKPKQKTCGCQQNCDCGELCAEANSFSFTTKEHVIDGTTYLEKQWLETCKNGDVIEWREVPAKTEAGTVEYVTNQRRICKLEVKPCGCVENSTTNKSILEKYCGCRFEVCQPKIYRPQPTCGTVVQEDCGKLYLIGNDIRDQYLVHFQEGDASEKSLVPEYAVLAVKAGIDFHCVMFNPKRKSERRDAKYFYNEQKLKVIEYLNPIDLEFIYWLQQQPRKLP